MMRRMVIALVLLATWVVLNVSLLGVVAFANHRGQVAAEVAAVAAPESRRPQAIAVAA